MNEDFSNRLMNEENNDDGIGKILSRIGYSNDNPLLELIIKMILVPKPFGIIWYPEKMEDFLKFRGYKIIERISEASRKTIKVAVKKGDKYIPDGDKSNIADVFEEEIQTVLVDWLKSISKN